MVIVLIGPAGAGKTTVGIALAAALGWRFVDADDVHSAHNRARLERGEALTDAERAPWLAALRGTMEKAITRGESLVLACSALKRAYRDALLPGATRDARQVRFVYLKTSSHALATRLRSRAGHFAPPEILGSQLATLEEPAPGEGVLILDGERSVAELIATIRRTLDA